MYYKSLSFLLLSATAMAQSGAESSMLDALNSAADNTDVANFLSASSIPTDLSVPGIPNSIVQVIATAIPTTFAQEIFTNSAARSSLANDLQSGNYPDWYSSIPGDVKTFISSYEATATATGSDSSSTGSSGSTSATDSSSSPTDSSSSAADSSSSATGSASASASESAGAESSTSGSGAPAQTGAMAAGIAGAAGILGLAFAL